MKLHGLIGRLGIPGSAKSSFVRSSTALGKTWVAITDPGEADGYERDDPRIGYVAANCERELFWDADFLPFMDKWEASGYGRLLKALYALRERKDITVVGIDSMTGVSELISHDVRKMTRSATLKDVGEYGLGYQKYAGHLRQLLGVLKLLAVDGKRVVCTFHVTLKEQEGAGTPAKNAKGDLEFEDRLLPVLEGSIRQHVSGDFSVWAYSVITGTGVGAKYFVNVLPDVGVPAKARLAPDEAVLKAKNWQATRIPNTLEAVLVAHGVNE